MAQLVVHFRLIRIEMSGRFKFVPGLIIAAFARVHHTQAPVRTRVPGIEEVALSEEIERLRERLAAAEAEVRRLTSSPLEGPRTWLRQRRRDARPSNR